jgi:hypothetical protein
MMENLNSSELVNGILNHRNIDQENRIDFNNNNFFLPPLIDPDIVPDNDVDANK